MLRFKVPEMSCGHCVETVTRAVKEVDARAEIRVDLDRGEVEVETAADAERIAQAIRDVGYKAARLAA